MSEAVESGRRSQGRQPLRIGLLLDDETLPAWARAALDASLAGGTAQIVLAVLNGAKRPRGRMSKSGRQAKHLLYALYGRLDRALFPQAPDAFERASIARLLAGVARLPVTPHQSRFRDRFPAKELDEIVGARLDVLVRFGFRILEGDILAAAKYGVWSYHHGDNLVNRGGPPGFWEVMRNEPVTGAVLQVLSERLDAGKVLCRAWVATNRRSVYRNKNHLYWRAAGFLPRMLRRLQAEGPAVLDEDPLSTEYRPYCGPLNRKPRNAEMARLLPGFAWRSARHKAGQLLSTARWSITYAFADPTDDAVELRQHRELTPPPDRYWADGFPAVHDGVHAIFFEEFLFGERRGRISAVTIGSDGEPSAPFVVLDEGCHMSYPFVFQWDGQLYMIPETADRRSVELYRCAEFPRRWERQETLLSGLRAVDPTIHRARGVWWMFVGQAREEASNANDELHLYMAESPLGPWLPHARNPVKEDVRNCRPAGALFEWRGNLYRPAQDCSWTYGREVVINRVERLDERGYSETEVWRVKPNWAPGLSGTHTYAVAPGLVVADVLRRTLPWQRGRRG